MVFNLSIELEKEKLISSEVYKKINSLIKDRIGNLGHDLLREFGAYFEKKGFKTNLVDGTIMKAEFGNIVMELDSSRSNQEFFGYLAVLDLKISGLGSKSGKYTLDINSSYKSPSGVSFSGRKTEEEHIKDEIEKEKQSRERALKRIEEFSQEQWLYRIVEAEMKHQTKYHSSLSECLDELLEKNTP
ncbi:hypothetical protein [Brevibacillus sp. NRS-1366]|uniref:hypothetical protein n=1 Tax=Brevibacillus sp. NRS-1366 TaxID=3233899 RepID=UPI003D1FDFA0